jgi:hypothetical protein
MEAERIVKHYNSLAISKTNAGDSQPQKMNMKKSLLFWQRLN